MAADRQVSVTIFDVCENIATVRACSSPSYEHIHLVSTDERVEDPELRMAAAVSQAAPMAAAKTEARAAADERLLTEAFGQPHPEIGIGLPLMRWSRR